MKSCPFWCAFIVIAACGGSDVMPAMRGHAGVRDSAGIEIIDLASVSYDGLPQWRLAEAPFRDIGRAEGEEAYLLFNVRDVVVLEGGSVALINDHEVRFFDGGDVFRWSQGGEGDGPGSYSGPGAILVARGDTLLVWDSPPYELNVIDPDGNFVRTVLPQGHAPGSTSPLGMIVPDRMLIQNCPSQPRPRGEYAEMRVLCDVRVSDLDGIVRQELGRWQGDLYVIHANGWMGQRAWSPHPVQAAARDGMWTGSGDAYEFRFWSDGGTLSRIVRWDGPDRTVSEEDVRTWDADVAEAIPSTARGSKPAWVRQNEYEQIETGSSSSNAMRWTSSTCGSTRSKWKVSDENPDDCECRRGSGLRAGV